MSDAASSGQDFEVLLASVLRPVEPPETLVERLETTLSAVSEAAASELSNWAEELSASELEALRHPRNWVRPVLAVAVGGAATGALLLLELRRRQRRQGALRSAADSLRSRL